MKTVGDIQNEARIIRALESISESLDSIKGYMKVIAANQGEKAHYTMHGDFPQDIQEMINKYHN